jgi:hypothetical protein
MVGVAVVSERYKERNFILLAARRFSRDRQTAA